jgi:hypothetical protein
MMKKAAFAAFFVLVIHAFSCASLIKRYNQRERKLKQQRTQFWGANEGHPACF